MKLSALHPRYEAVKGTRARDELAPRLLALAQAAKRHNLNFTVDAEEADRLELSLDLIAVVAGDASLAGWDGFGLAIQAYQKRAYETVNWIIDLARRLDRRFMVRLVKGPIGTRRSSARRSVACPSFRCSPARPRPTFPISPARTPC